MESKRTEIHLQDWALWHQADKGDARGYPGRSMGIQFETSQDFDEMVRDVDVRVAKIVETVVSDLAEPERSAVFHKFLRGQWRSTPEIYAQSIQSAIILIGLKLEKRGVF